MRVNTKLILICVIFCVCACNSAQQVSEEEFTPGYREFYTFAKGRENWLIDTLFYGVNSACYRYKDGCLFEYSQPYCKGCKGKRLPIFNRKGKAYIINLPIDSFYRKYQNEGYEFVYDLYKAVDIVKLMKDYRIEHVRVGHEKGTLWVNFFERGDSTIEMHYSTTEVVRINSDSTCVMKDWSICKEKKKSDEQLYN